MKDGEGVAPGGALADLYQPPSVAEWVSLRCRRQGEKWNRFPQTCERKVQIQVAPLR